MLDLKVIIEQYPRSVGTRSQLASLLHDLYPQDKRAINLALAVYDSGIAARIAKSKTVDSLQYHGYVKLLVDEYGLQEQFATEGITIWANAFGKPIVVTNGTGNPASNGVQARRGSSPDAYAKPIQIVNGTESDYELETKGNYEFYIKKFRGFDEEEIVIPNRIGKKRIVGIGEHAYLGCASLQRLIISEGIRYVDDGAFANCNALKHVTFPESLERIGSVDHNTTVGINSPPTGAFENCSIERIVLPNSIALIGRATFRHCKSLTKVVLPTKLRKIDSSAFWYCKVLTEIQFPKSLKEICSSAFFGCGSLTFVVLNEGLEKIGQSAFGACDSLRGFLMPSSVKEIEEGFSREDLFSGMGSRRPKDLTVYCYAGSYGLEYARERGYKIQNANNF